MPSVLDENEAQLLQEEEELIEELKLTQEKHKNVTLSYENIMENIKSLCKLDTKQDLSNINNNVSNSAYLNLNESKVDPAFEQSLISNQYSEEDLYKYYADFLLNIQKAFEENFLNKTEEEFIEMMKEKGYTMQQLTRTSKNGERPSIIRRPTGVDKDGLQRAKETVIHRDSEDSEYGYRDEDLKKEDDAFKLERDLMIKEFKEAV